MVSKNREDYRFYKIWADMKQRCNNPNCSSFYNYGGRGIQYCLEWMCYENFKNDMYPSYLKHIVSFGQKQTTLDRIDVNDHYYKENCRWATCQQQRINVRNKEEYCGYNLITNQFYHFNNCVDFCKRFDFVRKQINDVITGKSNMHHNCIFVKNDNSGNVYKQLLSKANELLNQNPKLAEKRKMYMENIEDVKTN